MKKGATLFVLAVTIVIFLPALLSFAIKLIPGRVQPSLNSTEKIYGKYVAVEPFLATRDNLSAIGTSIKNPNLKNIDDVVISVYDQVGNLLRESIVNGRNIPDGDFIKFKFDPIKDSKNRMFNVILYSRSVDAASPVEIFYTDQYPISKKVVDNQIICLDESSKQVLILDIANKDSCNKLNVVNNNGFTMSYVDFYANTGVFGVASDIYGQMIGRLLADFTFFVIYSFLVLILVIWSSYIYLPKLFSQED